MQVIISRQTPPPWKVSLLLLFVSLLMYSLSRRWLMDKTHEASPEMRDNIQALNNLVISKHPRLKLTNHVYILSSKQFCTRSFITVWAVRVDSATLPSSILTLVWSMIRSMFLFSLLVLFVRRVVLLIPSHCNPVLNSCHWFDFTLYSWCRLSTMSPCVHVIIQTVIYNTLWFSKTLMDTWCC